MTVKELASKMNELMREGKGDWIVLYSCDSIVSFHIRDIRYREDNRIIILTWEERKGLRAPETVGFTSSNEAQKDQ